MNGVDSNSSNDEKVKLFRSLFCGRGDVFARRFDNAKTGKKGYSPCCESQWVRGVCGLLRGVKCAECPNKNLLPVSDEVIRWHLRGKDGLVSYNGLVGAVSAVWWGWIAEVWIQSVESVFTGP